MITKMKIINGLLIASVAILFGVMIYFSNKEDKLRSKLYGVKIHGIINDMHYTNKVDYLNDGTISFVDYETNRRYHVATQYIVIGPNQENERR